MKDRYYSFGQVAVPVSALVPNITGTRRAPASSNVVPAAGQPVLPKDIQAAPAFIQQLTAPRTPLTALQLPFRPGVMLPGGAQMTSADFAAACKQAGGTAVGAKVCQFADGSQYTVDAAGKAQCVNNVGQCAGKTVAGATPLLLGGAALLALMLLR